MTYRPAQAAATLALAAGVALLAACTGSPDPAATDPAGPAPSTTTTPSSTPSATTAAKRLPGGPLQPTDLHGWKASAVKLPADWVSGCGRGTGVAKLQQQAKTSGLRAPGGVPVVVRVAHYRPGTATKALAGAQDLFTECPIEDVPGGQRTIAGMDAPAGQQAVGALVNTLDKQGAVKETVGYWIARVGDSTVEVWSTAQFVSATADDAMVAFSAAVRDAALAKAQGKPVPAVAVPAVAKPGTGASADPQAGTGADPDGADPGVSGGSLTDPGTSGMDDLELPPAPPGVGGESGPGVVSGSEVPTTVPQPPLPGKK